MSSCFHIPSLPVGPTFLLFGILVCRLTYTCIGRREVSMEHSYYANRHLSQGEVNAGK